MTTKHKGSDHHQKAARFFELAAKHHREAARQHELGHVERAAHHAQIAGGHALHGVEQSAQASKYHASQHDPEPAAEQA